MEIGAMTNPYRELLPQIDWIGNHDFTYVDLAVEPPLANTPDIDPRAVIEAAARYRLGIVVHTSPYLPIASRHRRAREAARSALLAAVELAKTLGSSLVTIHYLGAPAYYTVGQIIDTYADLLSALIRSAESDRVTIAIENSPSNRGEAPLFREIFRQVPEARLLLDIGHTHLHTDTNLADTFLDDPVLKDRLVHIHISDNNGLGDLHLPPGSVRNGIDWQTVIRRIRHLPYNGRMTLEVFSPDRAYLLISRDKLIRWWEAVAAS